MVKVTLDYWMLEGDQNGSKVNDRRFGNSGTEELCTISPTQEGGMWPIRFKKNGDKLSGGWGKRITD